MTTPSDSLDLDSLLSESLAERASKRSAPRPKELSKVPAKDPAWMNKAEKSDYERRRENAELRDLWKPQAAVAMFSVQICLSCGNRQTHFEGFYQQQRHASHRQTEKWVLATDSTMLKDLPRHRKVTIHEADSCLQCADALGYSQPSPTDTEPRYETWTTHVNHSKCSNEREFAGGFGSASQTPLVE